MNKSFRNELIITKKVADLALQFKYNSSTIVLIRANIIFCTIKIQD